MKKFASLNLIRQNTNIPLLIFLIFFLNVKLVVKIFALLFIMLYYRNMKWGLSWKNSRLPVFYILIILLEFVKYLLFTQNFSLNYGLVFCIGISQWAFCFFAIHHLKLAIDKEPITTINNTIRIFYFLNFVVSLFFLVLLIFYPLWLTYWGQGKDISFSHPSAGDAIIGISFDSSTVNATINCLGLIYFLYKRDYIFCFICLGIIGICTSNVSFIFIIVTLMVMIGTVRSNQLRVITFLAASILVFFYLSISAANRLYIHDYFAQLYILNKNPSLAIENANAVLKKPDTISQHPMIQKSEHLSLESTKGGNLKTTREDSSNKSRPPDQAFAKKDHMIRPEHQHSKKIDSFLRTADFAKTDSQIRIASVRAEKVDFIINAKRRSDSIHNVYSINKSKLKKAIKQLLTLNDHFKSISSPGDSAHYLMISKEDYDSKPGKLISFFQTYAYLKTNTSHLFFGSGVGNFSSKLAFRASGVGILGTYPKQIIYTAPDFRYNHLSTFEYYINESAGRHSVLNFPFSVYNQLFGEYGLIGTALFVIFYLGFFISRYRRLSYGRYMLFILLGFFFMEYWFEFLSLVVIFELFMLLNIKEGREKGVV
jgi:hypothetical protein